MTVSAEELLAENGGEVEKDLFDYLTPSQLEERLEKYLEQGATKAAAEYPAGTERDEATKLWAYHRTFKQKASDLARTESSLSVDGGAVNVAISAAQIRYFDDLAASYLARFEALVPPAAVRDRMAIPPSESVPHTTAW